MLVYTSLLCSLLIASSRSEITFESEHVLTVCDASTVRHTRRGQVIPECPLHLPPAGDFFNHLKTQSVYEKTCLANNTTDDSTPTNVTIERALLIVKQLVDGVESLVHQVMVSFIHAVEDVSGIKPVETNWSFRIYSIVVCVCFLFFHLLSRRRTDRLAFDLLLALLTSLVFYFAHLYYGNAFVTSLLMLVAVFVGSRLYVRTWLPTLSALTFAHLILPLSGFVLRLAVEVQLFFGPVVCLIMNGCSILVHVICLIGLFVDEKLLVVKVIFLPFYQTLAHLFGQNEKHGQLVDAIKQSVMDMTTGFLSSADFHNRNATQLNVMLMERLRQLCVNATNSWYSACPVLFARSCASLVDQTELSKVDKGLEVAGQWLTTLILPSLKGSTQTTRTLSKQLCLPIANSACRAINVTDYCTPSPTLYGQAFQSFSKAVESLKETVLFKAWLQLNSTWYESVPSIVHFTLDTDWIWTGRCVASFLLASLALVLLIRAFVLAFLFVRRYRIDFHFFTRRARVASWANLVRLKLLFKVVAFFLMDRAAEWTHATLQKIQFTVPEQGDARLAFNVQGNGTLATILGSVLGSFSIQSKYCTRADTSVCNTPFFTVNWPTWISLFTLSALYFVVVGVCEDRADDWMSWLCDRLSRRASRKKALLLKLTREERQRRRLMISILVDEALSAYRPEENRRILRFYRHARRHPCWYRFAPAVVQSMTAHYRCRVDCLACQVCFQNGITTRFRCQTLLFCDECRTFLKQCPCGRDICRDGVKLAI